MRIQNSLKNIFFGLGAQMLSVSLGFGVRTVFIYTLGVEYLGIEGLFTSVLIMLSLANLGFDSAMIYSLYKPLAEKDNNKIQALMGLYKKAYRIIGLIVLLIGLTLLPFIEYLIKGETTVDHIQIIYLLFLVNAVSSYYFVYKQSIIIADQQNHIISRIHSIFILLSNTLQIILLITTSNYILVLTGQILFRILENIYIGHKANQLYPFLKQKSVVTLSNKEKKSFYENLYSLMLYKISGVVINGTDNIIISVFVGLSIVGIYSNYLLILSTITTILSLIFYSITASVGNLVVQEDIDKKYFIFRVINFSNFWIYGFFTIVLWNLLNPLISVWIGDQFVFNKYILLTIILNFFTTGMQNASTTFRETTGLFKKGKYRPIIAAIINITVSIILAKEIGIAGVLIGTVVSRLSTYFWYDPFVIHKIVFRRKVKVYFGRYIWYSIIVLGSCILTEILCNLIRFGSLIDLFLKGLICLVIPNIIFFLFFRKCEEFQYLMYVISKILNTLNIKKFHEKTVNL
ncbi:lipopolysaccharide biosynthesis protein [Rossellomorea aquimaris]|uniref:lipopolysaccharide biosynthesis protein n=1 Tax=Rossellomorea aquimaris TaxID=189382 RepID=UPI0007D09153|nr:hypothetical protein [Rossellomorea aquimaris]